MELIELLLVHNFLSRSVKLSQIDAIQVAAKEEEDGRRDGVGYLLDNVAFLFVLFPVRRLALSAAIMVMLTRLAPERLSFPQTVVAASLPIFEHHAQGERLASHHHLGLWVQAVNSAVSVSELFDHNFISLTHINRKIRARRVATANL